MYSDYVRDKNNFASLPKTLRPPGDCTRKHTKVILAPCFFCVANCLHYRSQIKHRDRGFKFGSMYSGVDCVCSVYRRSKKCIKHLRQRIMEESDHLGVIDVDELCSILAFFTYRRNCYAILRSSSFNVQLRHPA